MDFLIKKGKRVVNLTGQKFGEWECLSYAGRGMWVCKCSCGTEQKIDMTHLKTGLSKRCFKCFIKDIKENGRVDLAGTVFNDWTVLEYRQNGAWLCRCKCGKEGKVAGYALRKGLSIRCRGCGQKSRKLSASKLDLTGQTFGDWVVLNKSQKRQKDNVLWECRCNCGNIRHISTGNLRVGATKSCRNCANVKGSKDESAVRHLFAGYRSAAKKRGYEWGLSLEQFIQITSSNCFYTGLPPSNVFKTKAGGQYIFNGVDRLDNTKGYVFENSVSCKGRINEMKMDSSYEDFIGMCYMVIKEHEKRNIQIIENKLKAV